MLTGLSFKTCLSGHRVYKKCRGHIGDPSRHSRLVTNEGNYGYFGNNARTAHLATYICCKHFG